MSKMRHNDIVIPPDGTDAFVNCKLDRKQYAEVLTSIVNNYKEGFVLAINNKWGTGKTTFVKMWQQHLKNNGYQTLYFNAWENDFQEEVIIALLSELEELREKDQENFDKLLEKTATFLKKVVPAAIKGAVSKAVGEEAVGEIAAAAMEFTTEEVEQHIATFNEKKKGITDFRNILEKFVDKVDNDKPVVFIIDELDRCRPDYAVKVLEQVKHLFSVPGIVFVLSIDKVQLGHAIRGVYGSDRINADEYLRRFIDLEYIIPRPKPVKVSEYFYEYYGFDEIFKSLKYTKTQNIKRGIIGFSSIIFNDSNISIRSLDKIFAISRIAILSFSKDFKFPQLFMFLVYLKTNNLNLYTEIKEKKHTVQELFEKLKTVLSYTDDDTSKIIVSFPIIDLVIAYFHYYHTGGLIEKTFYRIHKPNSDEVGIYIDFGFEHKEPNEQAIEDFIATRNKLFPKLNLSHFLNKIELLEPIDI